MDTINEEKIKIGEAVEHVILVRHAYKHYGSKKKPISVLVNFEMTVQRGTIYGLLGPSGAGKTSLLSCLIGRKKLNSGEVWVFGGSPGSKNSCVPGKCVGYMPQELSLYGQFTMKDMMLYFGWIYNMSASEIESRSVFLMEMLDLKTRYRKIKNLSGGQQRRVSLAIALMHQPELLILDEPTVGVDPVLRQAIWKHLVELVYERHTTVIITTHYIEEARQAHTIGLMRHGRLLAEDTPDNLLQIYNATSLEGVFLQLAYEAQSQLPSPTSKQNSIDFVPNHYKSDKMHSTKSNMKLKTNQMRALIFKNFLSYWRNPGIILFFLALPVVQVILFCVAIGGEPTDLLLAAVNDEVPNAMATGTCTFPNECNFENLSCRYLHQLDATIIDIKYYETLNEAKQKVEEGEIWGVLYFNQNFSTATISRQILPTAENVKNSQIAVYLDMSDQQINYMIQRDLFKAYMDFGKELLKTCKQNEDLLDYPISIKEPIYGNQKPLFKNFAAPGIIMTIIFFLSVGQTAISLISEQIEGMLDRTTVAGVTPAQILISHVLCHFLIMGCQTFLVLFFTLQIFAVECHGPMFWIVTLVMLQGICGMCYGYVISAACDVERTAIQIALGSFYPCIILSGVIWPTEGMHYILRYIAFCTPLTLAISSMRAMMSRGWGITMRKVYLGFIAPTIWICAFLIMVMLILKFKRG